MAYSLYKSVASAQLRVYVTSDQALKQWQRARGVDHVTSVSTLNASFKQRLNRRSRRVRDASPHSSGPSLLHPFFVKVLAARFSTGFEAADRDSDAKRDAFDGVS